MPKKTKKGKDRLDKFYRLAKETGYRSRACFKLIQLNRQYDFLGSARSVVDLCAAPGGWLQVAAKYMPVGSKIIGVDLVPIKPIRGCVTFAADITTDRCRSLIKGELKGAKADLVIHDGAPNVGTTWMHDAYGQIELTLHALRLATDVLAPGGTFVTKCFRSADYNSFLWVCHQLFEKVEATKPQASRNSSAEIFVVCRKFTAPKRIDPRLLDPKYIFKEVERASTVDVLTRKEGKKVKAVGYAEGATTLFKSVPVEEFVATETPIAMLGEASSFTFASKGEGALYAKHRATTREIRELCKDLRVLGKKDFRELLRWRMELVLFKEELEKESDDEGDSSSDEDGGSVTATTASVEVRDEEAQLNEDLRTVLLLEKSKQRRKKKRLAKQKAKMRQRLALAIGVDETLMEIADDQDLFALKRVQKLKESANKEYDDAAEEEEAEEPAAEDPELMSDDEARARYEELVERELDQHYAWMNNLKQRKTKAAYELPEGMHSFGKSEGSMVADHVRRLEQARQLGVVPKVSSEFFDTDAQHAEGKTLLRELNDDATAGAASEDASARAAMWFSDPLFAAVDDLQAQAAEKNAADIEAEQERLEIEAMKEAYAARKKNNQEKKKKKKKGGKGGKGGVDSDSDEDAVETVPAGHELSDGESDASSSSSSDSEDDDGGLLARAKLNESEMAEALAMGKLMLRNKDRRRIVDDAYNRYTFNDDPLPTWFAKEERRHMMAQKPVTKEMIEEQKLRFKALNVRNIKKVAEAKWRKRRRMFKQLEKARTAANRVVESEEISEAAKARAVERLYKRHTREKRQPTQFIVAKSGGGMSSGKRGSMKRSGPIKFVDRRMRSDLKAQKRAARKKKMRGGK